MIFEREEQPMKHISQSRSTEDGMEIDQSWTQCWNAPASMHETFEPYSKMTVEREEHPRKHALQSRSTEDGIPMANNVAQP
jgi:hypothetical protein